MIDDGNLMLSNYLQDQNGSVKDIVVKKKDLSLFYFAVVVYESDEGFQRFVIDKLQITQVSKYVFSAIGKSAKWPTGMRITAKEFLDRYMSIYHLSSPSDIHQSSVLDRVPSDCLFHIYQYLSPLEVVSASEASIALRNFAEINNVFKKMATSRTLRSLKNYAEIECVLRYVGKHLTEFKMNAPIYQSWKYSLALIFRNCPNLIKLTLRNVTLSNECIQALQKQRCSVKQLVLRRLYNIYDVKMLLKTMPQITALSL